MECERIVSVCSYLLGLEAEGEISLSQHSWLSVITYSASSLPSYTVLGICNVALASHLRCM